SLSRSGGLVVAKAITRQPAALAAAIPGGASSSTTHCEGGIPSSRAAARYPSGAGLPFFTSSANRATRGNGSLACRKHSVANHLLPLLTTAHGTSSRSRRASRAAAPGTG